MSILIDWDMPKACRDCPLQIGGMCRMYSDEEKRIDDIDLTIERPDWCQLIEIPTPHGRLIDADALINELASEHVGGLEAIKKYTNADTWTAGLHTAWRTIDDAPTVIEAED